MRQQKRSKRFHVICLFMYEFPFLSVNLCFRCIIWRLCFFLFCFPFGVCRRQLFFASWGSGVEWLHCFDLCLRRLSSALSCRCGWGRRRLRAVNESCWLAVDVAFVALDDEQGDPYPLLPSSPAFSSPPSLLSVSLSQHPPTQSLTTSCAVLSFMSISDTNTSTLL